MWFLVIRASSIAMFFILFGTIFLIKAAHGEETKYTARLVSILVHDAPREPFNYDVVIPAVDLAVSRVRKEYPHITFQATYRKGYTACVSHNAGVLAAEEYFTRGVSIFIGPGCSYALDSVARMASYWNIPVCTAAGFDASLNNDKIFSTYMRMTANTVAISRTILGVLKHFLWYHAVVLYDKSMSIGLVTAGAIRADVAKTRYDYMEVKFQTYDEDDATVNFTTILKTETDKARVFIIIGTGEAVRKIMLAAYDLGMGNGEFVFLSVELFNNKKTFREFSWFKEGDSRNQDAREIYEALFLIKFRVPTGPEYQQFVRDVIHRSQTKFNKTVSATSVNVIVAGFHDCVLMYAVALNKTLSEGADPSDGRTLIRRLWNHTFKHGLTGDIFINSEGDREADYTLNDLDPMTGEMKPVATYYGAHQRLELIPDVDINWPGGWTKPPPDVPHCGFKGDAPHCQENEPFPVYGYVIIIGGIVVFATVTVGLAAYRKVKLESELNNLWWKVQWDDIIFQDRGHRSLASIGTSEDKLSVTSEKYEAKSQIEDLTESTTHGIKIGLYKGIKVAVKTVKIQRLHVSRAILLELKQIRNITHENLVRFVGFCPDEPNIALLSEFISRGSLRELLDNDVIKIDWPFRFSIINDILEGLAFLHNSPVGFHGHLKSTNCVIDGRFMVKITDYGLLSLLAQVAPNNRPNPQTLLWTAPEHLRNKIFGQYGSEKGDIYSFAIILQEIVTRLQPFERSEKQNKMSPKEIIHKVKTGTKPPFRPEVSPEDCPLDFLNLLYSCWSEDPASRPQISVIKQQMKKLSKGMGSGNFLDSLLNRMEQYATNLEQLVEEKSSAFLEEKKKSEALLYQVIPRYIAEQLKAGCHVKPETFESVTIFFSDIVGFTSLSAESTAMEVVDLLNDLYTTFDDILENYDVYKVETIGDAYMVVSGLPVSNGNEHAREIARMSITLREAIRNFKIRHRPERTLQIRIGMHTGSCAAGVVGLKMPRYCLFGDTVNTASRMESNGEANKIHVSPTSKAILETFQTFVISVRGEVELKGKGKILTYWLEGETGGVLETNEQFLQRVKQEIMEMSD